MIKNILLYRWHVHSESYIYSNLKAMGYTCVEFGEKFDDCHSDAEFVMKVMDCIRTEKIDMVLSMGYLPLLASACEICTLPYAAWIHDGTHYALRSKTTLYANNFLLCFDRAYAMQLAEQGCVRVYHFPLAADADAFAESIRVGRATWSDYAADISFVGDLYDEKGKWLETEEISEYVKGYLAGIEEIQLRVYGRNFVGEMINEDMAHDILRRADLQPNDLYFDNPVQLAADLVNQDITRKERMQVIERLSQDYPIDLYTESIPASEEYANVKLRDTVDYHRQMPLVFHNSKINLNVTARTIETGIPQKVLDIMACGGFCLTNYQPEIAEFLEDGKELVMYTDMEDLAKKTEYYLRHDEARESIARAGYEKVRRQFSMRDRLAEMLEIVERDMD